jgi:hypothetical protein
MPSIDERNINIVDRLLFRASVPKTDARNSRERLIDRSLHILIKDPRILHETVHYSEPARFS